MVSSPTAFAPAADFLPALLDLLPAGVVGYLPVFDAGGEVVDFAFAYLNPAARRMMGLPAQFAATYLGQWPGGVASGSFAFFRDTFRAGTPAQRDQFYQADGKGMYLRAHATRLGAGLLVTFSDAADQPRTAVEEALRESQAREQAARAEAERQRNQWQALVNQAPVALGLFEGPELRITAANQLMSSMWGRTQAEVLGRPLLVAVPELQGQGFEDLMRQVRETRVPFVGTEAPAEMLRNGQLTTSHYNFVYQPLYDEQGEILGVLNVAVEVTEQVLARRLVEEKERHTHRLNEELQAANAAISANNAALAHTQQQLRHLNEGLEVRVAERTGQLDAQQALLRQILMQVPASVATVLGPEHRFAFFNDHYLALTAGRAALGRPVAEVLPEVVAQGFIGLLDQVYTTGVPFEGVDMPIQLLDRATGQPTQHYVGFTYQPLRDGQGHIQGILAFILDTTEEVLARRQNDTLQAAVLAAVQHQAQQRQEIYEIFAQTPVAIVLLREPDHRIDYFNTAFETLFPPEEWAGPLRGHTIGEVYPRIRLAGLVALLDRVFATGEPQVVIEMPLAALQPGSPRYVTFSYQAYHEQGRVAGVAAFAYDVTEQVLARQQVQAANEELHRSNARLLRTNADLDTFVYSASHDLKSPITNIEGLLLALRQQLPPEALRADLVLRLLDMMDGAVARFQQTLGHLTDVSRLPQDLAGQPAEAVDLPALVESVRLDILPELTAAGAILALDLAACPTLYFPAKTLRSILYNLLSNAVKYRAPGRPALVQLRCHCLPGQVVLEVQDNGLGLSAAQQSELFQLFRRLHAHVSGSGVGLYMVKKMVDNAGGTLAVQSQPGVGSTFTVALPAVAPRLP